MANKYMKRCSPSLENANHNHKISFHTHKDSYNNNFFKGEIINVKKELEKLEPLCFPGENIK